MRTSFIRLRGRENRREMIHGRLYQGKKERKKEEEIERKEKENVEGDIGTEYCEQEM